MESKLPTIHVYISYKTKDKPQLDQLEQAFNAYNKKPESKYKMEVIYSENTLDEGDNIVEFMDKIAVAGMVVSLLSTDYFNSPYCWYELIKTHEKGSLSNRTTLLPIQFKDFDQVTDVDELKTAIASWKKDDHGLCKLSGFLKIPAEQVTEKIENVEAEVLKNWFENVIDKKSSDETVQEIEKKTTTIFAEESKAFDQALLKNIKHALSQIPQSTSSWEFYSGVELNIEALANVLMNMSYDDALIEIKAWAEDENQRKPSSWHLFFNKIQKLAGWFVLKSIKQDWWINHKLALTDGISNQEFVAIFLEQEQFCYSEVILSRSLLDIIEKSEPALFSLDKNHDLIPPKKQGLIDEYNDFIIDCCDDAKIETVLKPLFIDIKKIKPDKKDAKQLLAEFIRLVTAEKERYLYLVRQSYLQQMQACKSPVIPEISLLAELNQSLKEKLVFIVIDAKQKPEAIQASDNAEMALTYMQKILLVDKTYQAKQ